MNQPKHFTQEADIGSGERNPGQQDTDKMIEQVSPDKPPVPTTDFNQPDRVEKNKANAQSGNPP